MAKWVVTHIGRSTVQDFIGQGEPTVPEKCKSVDPLPCPFCAEALDPENDGWEHPASDSCPLDSLFILHRHVDGWNRRVAEEDTALNAMTDSRADGPFVPVSLDDLGACRSRRDYATVAAGITERILAALSGEAQR